MMSKPVEYGRYVCLVFRRRWGCSLIINGKLSFYFRKKDIHSLYKLPWHVLLSKGHAWKSAEVVVRHKRGFMEIFFENIVFEVSAFHVQALQYSQIFKHVNKFGKVERVQYEHWMVHAFNIRYSMQRWGVLSFSGTKLIGVGHSVLAGSATRKASIWPFFYFSNSLSLHLVLRLAEWIVLVLIFLSPNLCCTALVRTVCPHKLWNGVRVSWIGCDTGCFIRFRYLSSPFSSWNVFLYWNFSVLFHMFVKKVQKRIDISI